MNKRSQLSLENEKADETYQFGEQYSVEIGFQKMMDLLESFPEGDRPTILTMLYNHFNAKNNPSWMGQKQLAAIKQRLIQAGLKPPFKLKFGAKAKR